MPMSAPDAATQPTRAGLPAYALWVMLCVLLAVGFAVDGPVLAVVKPLHHSRLSDVINQTIRLLGTGYVQPAVALLMIAAGAFAGSRLKQAGVWTLLAFLAAGIAANVLKVIVHRPRPWTIEPPPPTWLGYLRSSEYQAFPSAEAATTFAVAIMIGAWYPRWAVPLLIVAVLVAIGRVIVGSHHPSDVVAGAMLGIAVSQTLTSFARHGPVRRSLGGGGEAKSSGT